MRAGIYELPQSLDEQGFTIGHAAVLPVISHAVLSMD